MNSCLSRFKTAVTLQNSISPDHVNDLLLQGRDKMITTDSVPTINIARITFGQASVELIIKQHLFDMVKALGIDSTEDTLSGITADIISGFGYLKLTELILAFKMMREGRFRTDATAANPLGQNAARPFGNLSSATICDCLTRFQFEYRNNVLSQFEQQQRRQAIQLAPEATYPEKCHHIYEAILRDINDPSRLAVTFRFFSQYLKPQDMTELEQVINEQQRLLAENVDLRTKVQQLEYIKDAVFKTAKITDPATRDKCFSRLLELATEYNSWFTTQPTVPSSSDHPQSPNVQSSEPGAQSHPTTPNTPSA